MTRVTRILLALVAIFAVAAIPAAAHKSHSPGKSDSAPQGKSYGEWHGNGHGKKHGKKHGKRHGATKLTSGTTTLELDAATTAALTGAGFGVTPAVPATATGTTFSFPITKGRVQLGRKHWKLKAVVKHSGGITFTKGAVSVTASDLRIEASKHKARVYATIGGERVRLLKLTDVAVADGKGTANAVLAKDAATRLNAAFAVTLFTKGLAIGKVTVTPGA